MQEEKLMLYICLNSSISFKRCANQKIKLSFQTLNCTWLKDNQSHFDLRGKPSHWSGSLCFGGLITNPSGMRDRGHSPDGEKFLVENKLWRVVRMNNGNKIDQAVYELLLEEANRYGFVICSFQKLVKDVMNKFSGREYDQEQEELILHSIRRSLSKLELENTLSITNKQGEYLEIVFNNLDSLTKSGILYNKVIDRFREILEKKENEIRRLQLEKKQLFKELDKLSEEVRLLRQKGETPDELNR